jgi:hypothetical protein
MKLKCLILGCKWRPALSFWSVNELLEHQQCERCGSTRTVSQ